ncbi:MAG: hypothetical protein E6J71_01855 [Deltaproteobacteria bacterium]|nr:MAG: hypothetical protein E6J71_01855 [Deltaproteobacteria bacterium]
MTVANPQGCACPAPSITGAGTSHDSTFPEPTNLNSRMTPPDTNELKRLAAYGEQSRLKRRDI